MKQVIRVYILCLAVVCCFSTLGAHELRPAYLEIKQTGPEFYQVFWKVPARGPERRLPLVVQFPEPCQVVGEASSRFTGEAWTESSLINCVGGIDGKIINIDGLTATLTDVLVRVESLQGSTQIVRLTHTSPFFIAEDKQSLLQSARLYLTLGIEHIWSGADHLLFVLALMILIKGWGKLIGAITSFTIAHSLTLAAATLGFIHVPAPPVEAWIALSIVFVAREIIRSQEGVLSLSESKPWIIAFCFGLLHGLGFAGALTETGLPSDDIPIALLFFNIGVEIGQIAFIIAVLFIQFLIRKIPIFQQKWLKHLIPYGIGGVSAFWVIQRVLSF